MYTIRTATKADASALGYLHYTCWCETYAGKLDPGYLSKGSAEKSAAIFLRNGCRDMFLAEEDGSPIGFCGYSISRDNDAAPTCGEIDGIYLLQRCQGVWAGHTIDGRSLSGPEIARLHRGHTLGTGHQHKSDRFL